MARGQGIPSPKHSLVWLFSKGLPSWSIRPSPFVSTSRATLTTKSSAFFNAEKKPLVRSHSAKCSGLTMINLFEALLQSSQVDMALFSSIQCFPEFSNSFVAFVFRLSGCHNEEICYRSPFIICCVWFFSPLFKVQGSRKCRGRVEKGSSIEGKHKMTWGMQSYEA